MAKHDKLAKELLDSMEAGREYRFAKCPVLDENMASTKIEANNSEGVKMVAPRNEIMRCRFCGAELPKDSTFCNMCGKKVTIDNCCPDCGAVLPEGSVFCNKCGKRVIVNLVCRKCGAELPEGSTFCHKCGNKCGSELPEESRGSIERGVAVAADVISDKHKSECNTENSDGVRNKESDVRINYRREPEERSEGRCIICGTTIPTYSHICPTCRTPIANTARGTIVEDRIESPLKEHTTRKQPIVGTIIALLLAIAFIGVVCWSQLSEGTTAVSPETTTAVSSETTKSEKKQPEIGTTENISIYVIKPMRSVKANGEEEKLICQCSDLGASKITWVLIDRSLYTKELKSAFPPPTEDVDTSLPQPCMLQATLSGEVIDKDTIPGSDIVGEKTLYYITSVSVR